MIKLPASGTGVLVMILLATAVVIGGPIALIWGLNTLFPVLNIPYSLETWLAAFIVPASLKANVNINKKD
jgi:hypothetical protein